jgi:protein-S-isoprenylcysteine O-methyltransferase Ste14
MLEQQSVIVFKSIMHNLGVVAVGLFVAWVGTRLDSLFGIGELHLLSTRIIGTLLLIIGFLIRLWATYYFYENRMRIVSIVPQGRLLTTGPYRYSRNPLYLGGNVFVFFGAALLLGSPAAIAITVLHLPLLDLFIRREERQLERDFGEEWGNYKHRVRRWI